MSIVDDVDGGESKQKRAKASTSKQKQTKASKSKQMRAKASIGCIALYCIGFVGSSLLDHQVGAIGAGILDLAAAVAALVIGAPLVVHFRCRRWSSAVAALVIGASNTKLTSSAFDVGQGL